MSGHTAPTLARASDTQVLHTPGPWKWWTSNSWRRLARDDSRGGHFAWVLEPIRQNDGHPDCLVSEADMGLIAAAPDLLAALQAIADESVFNQQRFAEDDDTDYFLRCFRAVKERARAAITKATTPVSR